MAKCIKEVKTGNVKRVSDNYAWEMVKTGNYTYCPKEEWKKQERK